MALFHRMAVIILCLYLGISNGQLALFENMEATPLRVLPYEAASFPIADQNALAQGIPIPSENELNRLLEDFLA